MSYYDEVMADNPYGYWRLNEATTATPPQTETTQNINGVWEGTPLLGQPPILRNTTTTSCRLSSPENNTHISWDDRTDFTFGDGVNDSPFTFECWIYITTLNAAERTTLFNKDNNTTSQREYNIYLTTDRRVGFELHDLGGHQTQDWTQRIVTTNPLAAPLLGERYHIVCTYDGRGGNAAVEGMAIWVNGELQTVGTTKYTNYVAMLTSTAATFRFGRYGFGAGFGLHTDSNVSDLALYRHVLSQQRIEVHALSGHYIGWGQVEHVFKETIFTYVGGPVEHNLQETITPIYGRARHDFQEIIYSWGTTEHNIQEIIEPWHGQVEHNVKEIISTHGTVEHNFRETIVDPTTVPFKSASWRVSVIVDGVDITTQLTGRIVISAEENAARTSNLIFFPPPGLVEPDSYIGKPVSINYIDAGGLQFLLFQGIVDTPVYDPVSQTLTLNSTDQYQELLESMAKPDIDALIGGYWSKHVFREDVKNYQYATDRLSTVRASLDLTVARSFQLATWDTENVDAFATYYSDHIYDNSKAVRLADRRNIRNRTSVTFSHRYQRLYHRERYPGWSYPFQWCQYLQRSTNLPNRDMILVSIERSGWLLASIAFSDLPESGSFRCGQSDYFWSNVFPSLTRGYNATTVRRWTQTLTGNYSLILDAVDGLSVLPQEASHALNTPYDPANWESQANSPTGEQEDGRWGSGVSVVGRDNLTTYKPPTNSVQNSWKDWILDEDDRAEADNAILTVLAVQRKELIKKHRQNYVSWKMPIEPRLERAHVLALASYNMNAKGKTFKYVHTLDLITGEASTAVTIALSRAYGAQAPDQSLFVPAKPDITPDPPLGGIVLQISQSTQIGGDSGSPPHDPDKDGFSGNYGIISPGSEVYPIQFLTILPPVEDEFREPASWSTNMTYQVRIPNDKLTLSAT